ncbi:MAG: hypothetical protein FRX49_11681 [Trebouxia sp. A1-2]|nr:MAG: hypothetical protein FRX49_11681 [Trebouxia sp. A1-2]
MSSPTTAKMMVLTAVIVIVAMMVGQHQLRGGETNLTQSLFQTSLSRNSYGKFLQKGSFKSACPEIPTGSRKFLHKGLTAKPVLTGSEQAQFRTLNREETYGAVLELGMKMAEGCQEQEAKSNQNHRDEIEEQAATDRQTSGKKGHANLIKEDKGMWRGLLQYAAHAPDVPAEGQLGWPAPLLAPGL